MLFTRPQETELYVERRTLEGEVCSACGSDDMAAYPAFRSDEGWQLVARCQSCLAIDRVQLPPTPFGFSYLPYSAYIRGF